MFDHETIGRRSSFYRAVAGVSAAVALWLALSVGGFVPSLFLPGPRVILQQLENGPPARTWLWDLLLSCARIFAGFLTASVIAVPLGVYMGTRPKLAAALSPLIEFCRYVPVPALLPLCILWTGIGELEKVSVVFLGTFFQLSAAVADAAHAVPSDYVDVARVLGLRRESITWRVVFPAACPRVFDMLRISLGWAWSYLVVAEIVAASAGVGYRIMSSQRYLQVGLVFVGLLELGCLGILFDLIARRLRQRLLPWTSS